MSVYDNNKVYPTHPTVPEDDAAKKYRLQKVSEIEAFFLHEIEEREKLAKKVKWISKIILVAATGLIITTLITGSISISAFASDVAISVELGLTRESGYAERSFSY